MAHMINELLVEIPVSWACGFLDLAWFPIAFTSVHQAMSSVVTCAESSSEYAEGSLQCQYISMPFDACAAPQPDPEPASQSSVCADSKS